MDSSRKRNISGEQWRDGTGRKPVTASNSHIYKLWMGQFQRGKFSLLGIQNFTCKSFHTTTTVVFILSLYNPAFYIQDCMSLLSHKAWQLEKAHGFNFFPGTQRFSLSLCLCLSLSLSHTLHIYKIVAMIWLFELQTCRK